MKKLSTELRKIGIVLSIVGLVIAFMNRQNLYGNLFYDEEKVNNNYENPNNIPEFLHEKIQSVQFDASVVVPTQIRKRGYRSAEVNDAKIDVRGLTSDLFKDYEFVENKSNQDKDMIELQGKDGASLFYLKSGLFSSMSSKKYEIYSASVHDDPNLFSLEDEMINNLSKYPENQEIEGVTLQTCQDRMKKFLEYCGASSAFQMRTYALDYRIMRDEAKVLEPDGSLSDLNYSWTPSDNGYYCKIYQTANGTPIIPENNMLSGDLLAMPAVASYMDTMEVVDVYATGLYKIKFSNSQKNFYPFHLVKEKIVSDIEAKHYESATVKSMTLVSVVQNRGEHKELEPVWSICFECTDLGQKASYSMNINACTGEIVT